MRTRYEAALKAALKKGEVCSCTALLIARQPLIARQVREDKLPKSLPKKDARAQINDVRAFYQVLMILVIIIIIITTTTTTTTIITSTTSKTAIRVRLKSWSFKLSSCSARKNPSAQRQVLLSYAIFFTLL